MALYYFDTSALVKRYHVESGTEKVDRIFAESDESFIISNITIPEMTSSGGHSPPYELKVFSEQS